MLNINKETDGNNLTIALSGRLDTTTAPELESELKGSLDGITALIMDCKELEYISSAGLRVFLSAQKTMNKQGGMIELRYPGIDEERERYRKVAEKLREFLRRYA
mgnify:CR=1 FL=1